jgi:threonine synthase
MHMVKVDGKVEVPASVLEVARRDFIAKRISDELVCIPAKLFIDEFQKLIRDRDERINRRLIPSVHIFVGNLNISPIPTPLSA